MDNNIVPDEKLSDSNLSFKQNHLSIDEEEHFSPEQIDVSQLKNLRLKFPRNMMKEARKNLKKCSNISKNSRKVKKSAKN